MMPGMDEGWDERHREAMEPVEEAGGGEAEGFEMAEERLVEEAENFDEGRSPLRDEIDEAASPATAEVYGEADEEHSSEDEDDDR